MSSGASLLDQVDTCLSEGADSATLQKVLECMLEHFDCAVGTIHRLSPDSGMLELMAEQGIPEVIRDKVAVIPIGKGMAGIAAERREPVQVCNLQTDDSGVAKAGAKETKMEGSIACPMLVGETLCGTVGVAKPVAYEFTDDEIELLRTVAERVGRKLTSGS